MAQTLEQIRNANLVSIKGRRLGLSPNTHYLGGFPEFKRIVTNATSDTTGTALTPYGIHLLVTTTNDTWNLTAPEVEGTVVRFGTGTTSTGSHIVSAQNAVITCTASSAATQFTMDAVGEAVELVSVTTGRWLVTSNVNGVVFA